MSSHAGLRLVPVELPGPAGRLEGLLQFRDPEPETAAALVCHPHPLYGGTMHNKVVHRIASVMVARGATVLRFNFRGVGHSQGTRVGGEDEIEDARAAWSWLAKRSPSGRRWLAGFSFGSWVAARLSVEVAPLDALVLVAPPVTRSSFDVLGASRVPKLVVQGTADTVCPPEALARAFPGFGDPKRRVDVEGASHFFDRKLSDLAHALDALLADVS
jgi:alpha/beta superfamily hydrolase